MLSWRALCCLPREAKNDFHVSFRSMYYYTIIRFGSCDIQHNCYYNQGLGKGYRPSAFGFRLITPTSTLIIMDITETSSNNCL